MDSIIYLLNKWRQKSYHHLPACHFLFYYQGLYTETSWSQLQEQQVQTHNMTTSFVALFFIVTSNGFSVILHCLVPSPKASLSGAAYAFRITWLRASVMTEKAWEDARQERKEDSILPSEKSLDCQHEMEYHVIRLVVVLHDCPVGKNVTSERANEASALRSLPLI